MRPRGNQLYQPSQDGEDVGKGRDRPSQSRAEESTNGRETHGADSKGRVRSYPQTRTLTVHIGSAESLSVLILGRNLLTIIILTESCVYQVCIFQ